MSFIFRTGCTAAAIAAAGITMSLIAAPATAQQRQAPPAQQQPPPQAPPRIVAVEINQPIIEKWLVFYVDFVPKLLGGKLQEAQVQPTFQRACRSAGLTDIAQCEALDRYMAALLSGAQQESNSFVDPKTKLRRDLQALLADRTIPADQKAAEKADIEEYLATLPDRIPEAHIALLNRNAKRVFDAMAKIPPPPAPAAPAPGPAPGQKR